MARLSMWSLAIAALLAAGVSAQTVHDSKEAGVTLPSVTKEVRPQYTREALDAHIEGIVVVSVVVLDDGKVGEVKLTRSLDPTYGLDKQAIAAAKLWEFKPGTKDGKAAAVRVDLELKFTLK